MSYDLVIRGGTVVDGSGLPRYRADVGIVGDRIARIGTIHARGREEVDARHQIVAPGFIDGTTHMDAQVAWDPLGTCSCFDHVLEMMKHPRSVVTFSDSGAHVSQIMDSSLQTQVLAYWVRRRQALTLEEGVRMLSFEPASAWGLHARGLLREGLAADVIVFDPDRVAPEMPEVVNDLPAGARRLRQKATGFHASIVNGRVVLRDGEHTGAYPGRVLRGPLAAER